MSFLNFRRRSCNYNYLFRYNNLISIKNNEETYEKRSKNYQNFNEAKDLVKAGGILSVKSTNDFNKKIDLLLSNKKKREELGEINYNYIKLNSGATKKVLNKIKI